MWQTHEKYGSNILLNVGFEINEKSFVKILLVNDYLNM